MTSPAHLVSRSNPTRHLLHLDFLRGIAAICVVIGHRRPWFNDSILPHYFLAVDFFFILSGFVIDRAYRAKIGRQLSPGRFIVVRLIRLYPLIILGVLLGMLVALARGAAEGGNPVDVLMSGVAHLLLIPGVGSDKHPYPLNDPMWSLFFELAANLAFLVLAPILSRLMLTVIVAATAIGFTWIAVDTGSFAQGHLLPFFEGGFLRVGFGFFAGCLLHRIYAETDWNLTRFRPEIWTPLALVAIFQFPRVGVWFELFLALCIFPALVFAGAHAKSVLPRIETISGELSYPLYVLHIPLLFLVAGVMRATNLSDGSPGAFEGLVRIGLVCTLAWAAYLLFDKPVRRWLSGLATGNRAGRVKH